MQIIKFLLDNNENQQTLNILCENTKTTNHGNHIIPYENHENHEIIELHLMIM